MAAETAASALSSVQAGRSGHRPCLFPPSIVPNQSGRRYHGGARAGQGWGKAAAGSGKAQGGPPLIGKRALSKKGGPDGRPLHPHIYTNYRLTDGLGSAAALLAVLSSPDAGAGAEELDLMPCSRSSAIFSALSSLASGGT